MSYINLGMFLLAMALFDRMAQRSAHRQNKQGSNNKVVVGIATWLDNEG